MDMKAVILAGGGDQGLRPLTLERPGAMLPLLGRTVLEHQLELLDRHGLGDAALALRPPARGVADRLAEVGQPLPLLPDSPRRWADFAAGEPLLVLEGDQLCGLDLTALAQRHRQHRADASLALVRPADRAGDPVRTDRAGRVLSWGEGSAWEEAEGLPVYAGACILSPKALALGGEDFDVLFPRLLEQGLALWGWESDGLWQPLEDCRDYLACCIRALEAGLVRADDPGLRRRPETGPARILPPCWIGPRVSLAPGCVIGPCTVLEAGTTVATGAVVERSVLLGASVGEGAELNGAILGPGAFVHPRAMVGPGAVLGAGAVAEAESILAPGVKLWPGRRVPAGGRASASQLASAAPAPLRFSQGATLSGSLGEELTPELLLALGSLLGCRGQIALGWAGGEGAALLGRSAACGVAASGGTALISDAPCASAAAWLGRYSRLAATLFLHQDGDRVRLRLTGPDAQPLDRQTLRQLEGGLLRGELSRVPGSRVGTTDRITGVAQACALAAARQGRLTDLPQSALPVWVPKGSPEDELLARALSLQGCRVSRGEGRGLPILSAHPGGLALSAWDEEGRPIGRDRLLVLLARIHWEQTDDRVALPAWAPAAADRLAGRMGTRLLRLGRAGPEAEALWLDQPWAWDGIFAACRLCARLALTGERLADLDRSLPPFATLRREVSLRGQRGAVLEAVLDTDPNASLQGEVLRSRVGEGWVCLTPLSRRSALRLVAEAADMETAAELCDLYARKLRRLDESCRERGAK